MVAGLPKRALYFVDTDGIIRDHHFGEGRYEQSERVIQRLLGVEREFVSVEGLGVEAEADWDHLRMPETYLGYGRSEHFASPAASRRRRGSSGGRPVANASAPHGSQLLRRHPPAALGRPDLMAIAAQYAVA